MKKTKTKVEEVTTKKIQTTQKANKKWVVKDRVYRLRDLSPLVYILKNSDIMYFDEEAGYEREVRATLNQRTVFVDEFKGDARPEHIIFRDGILAVPKNKTILQQVLSLYHPFKDNMYEEVDEEVIATDDLADIELELTAMNAAKNLETRWYNRQMQAQSTGDVSTLSAGGYSLSPAGRVLHSSLTDEL